MNCPRCGGEDFESHPDPFNYGDIRICGGCGLMKEERSDVSWISVVALILFAVYVVAAFAS